MALESSVIDATIRRVTLESSITILEASYTLIYDVYSAGINYDDCKLTIAICLMYMAQLPSRTNVEAPVTLESQLASGSRKCFYDWFPIIFILWNSSTEREKERKCVCVCMCAYV
jgi:hypothetical protein